MKKNKSNNNKKTIKKLIFIILLILFLLICSFVCIFIYKINKNGGGIEGIATTIVGTDKETVKNLPPVYVLLLGESLNLTDTIMLVKYEPKEQKASLLSIPRDTFIGNSKSKATPIDKINALCQHNNPEKTVKAVSKLTGIPVTNYILINTDCFKELVDIIGGVYFDVPIDMNYEDHTQNLFIHVKAGYQLLDGETAEGVVRFRHNQDGSTYDAEYGEQDFGRTKTQREFLKVMAKQILQPKNILKLNELLSLAYNNIKTNIALTEFKDYIPALINFNPDNLKSDVLPGESKYLNGYAFVVNDEEKTKTVIKELFLENLNSDETENSQNTVQELIGTGITVKILNATDNSNILKNLEEKLIENGYTVVEKKTTSTVPKTVIINNTNKSQKESNDLITVIGIGESQYFENQNIENEISNTDFTIIIGTDY